jgi:dethiobiotin synthetase
MIAKSHRVFISGTGTNVGKTYITKNIIKLFKNNKLNIAPYKPIETGCKKVGSTLMPPDSQLFYKLMNSKIDLDNINPYRFKNPISPNRAIKLSKKKIYLKDFIKKYYFFNDFDFLIIEGAGGLCSPIALDGLNIDLIKKMKIPTILVAKDEIGVINNVLMSLNIIKKYKIKILCIVLNKIHNKQPLGMNNYYELKDFTKVPIIQITNNHQKNKNSYKKIMQIIMDD